jgi:hypothetical protein
MFMLTIRARVFKLVAGAAAVVTAALLVYAVLFAERSVPDVHAFGTNTPTPVGTPKPSGTTPVGGLVDIDVGPGLYQCTIWIDSNVSNDVKAAAQCNTLVAVEFTGGEPPCEVSHSTGATPAPVRPGEGNCSGHSGPPPYSPLAPFKLVGTYDPTGSGSVSIIGCFEDTGTNVGPNAVGRLTYSGATAFQAAPAGSSTPGTALFWLNQDNAACTAAQTTQTDPIGVPGSLPITITKPLAGDTRDMDGDGCPDREELLAHKGSTMKCGDDPFNPLDANGASPDVSGAYDIRARVVRNNTAGGAGFNVANAGFYYECRADIQQSGKDLTARILCYIDAPGVTVNPQAANGSPAAGINNCPPADPKFCGDGMPAASPPGCSVAAKGGTCATLANQGTGCPTLPCDVSQYQFADIDDKHTVLLGTLDHTTNNMELAGCFEDRDGFGQLGNVYVRAKINAHTGVGMVVTYAGETTPNCTGGTPAGAGVAITLTAVRQEPGDKSGGCTPNTGVGYTGCRDGDGDGCPDKRELGDTPGGPTGGGLRDPLNRWDYFNPEKVNTPHAQTVADILKVVSQYGKNQGNAAYTIDTDRTAIIGGNVWNLGPSDGQQTVADILAAVKQYNQNC